MPFSVRFVIIDVKYVSTLERRQEMIALNKSPTGASDLPLSLRSEIISILCFPCHLEMFLLEDGGSLGFS